MSNRIKFLILILIFVGSCTNQTSEKSNKHNSIDSTNNTEYLNNGQHNISVQDIRNELHNSIANLSYNSKSYRQVIKDHIIELFTDNKLHEISNPVDLIRKNADAYDKFIRAEDMILYDDQLAIKIGSLMKNNEHFRKQLIKDKLREYDKKITLSNLDLERNPQIYAKAFAVYHRFGSEALTDYINIYEYYVPNSPLQSNKVNTALRHFHLDSKYKEISPIQYAEDFFRNRK